MHQESFLWHPQAQLRGVSSGRNGPNNNRNCSPNRRKAQQANPTVLNGIHYIVDVNCESTLLCLRRAVTHRQSFCVHPPQYKPESDDHQIEHAASFQCLSSGTSGVPKRIRRTHRSWIASFSINAQLASITSADSYAIIGKLTHSLSLYAALEAAYLGADLHTLADLRPDRQLKAIASLQSSILYATPTQLRLLCKHATAIDRSKLSIRHIFCGGGKLDRSTELCVRELFQRATVQEFYGATETSFISISDNHTPAGSVGKPYPGVTIAIGETPKRPDGYNALAIGEIWVSSPYLFQSYADQHAVAARWQDDYVSVGELGYFDNNGYLFLTGRRSRRINIADTVVYPEEVETALLEHQAVSLCAVIPVQDDQRGCVLVAVVEAPGSVRLKQKLLSYLRQCVGPLKAPRDIVFVPTMPLLASGKPDLYALELQLTQRTQQYRPS